ncbi:MAG: hypothetical protein KAR42_10615 [candidate division Zixibacteria bacterium]|nr:hypothetical protein [candidate division Zixibacteria bacterium]
MIFYRMWQKITFANTDKGRFQQILLFLAISTIMYVFSKWVPVRNLEITGLHITPLTEYVILVLLLLSIVLMAAPIILFIIPYLLKYFSRRLIHRLIRPSLAIIMLLVFSVITFNQISASSESSNLIAIPKNAPLTMEWAVAEASMYARVVEYSYINNVTDPKLRAIARDSGSRLAEFSDMREIVSSDTISIKGECKIWEFDKDKSLKSASRTIAIDIYAQTIKELRDQFKEIIYGSFIINEKPDEISHPGLCTNDPSSFATYVEAVKLYNNYDKISIDSAIDKFQLAHSLDSNFFIPTLLGVSSCYYIKASRMWEPTNIDIFLNESQRIINIVERQLPSDFTHPLLLKTQGDIAQSIAARHLTKYFQNGENSTKFGSIELNNAKELYLKALGYTTESIQLSPYYYKIKNNLGIIYQNLSHIAFICGSVSESEMLLDLASRATLEASKLYALDNGPKARYASCRTQKYLYFKNDDIALYNEIQELLTEITSDSTISDMWKANAFYTKAKLACHQNDSTLTFNLLDSASTFGMFNVLTVAKDDPDFKNYWHILRSENNLITAER